MLTPSLTETSLRILRDEVFGPCTVIGECMTLDELRIDIRDILIAGYPFNEWFNLRIQVEEHELQQMREGMHPDGPTEAQLTREKAQDKQFIDGIKQRFEAFINHNPITYVNTQP